MPVYSSHYVRCNIRRAASLRLQAWMPCAHVWPKFESPGFPHLLNQVPPRAQQLRLPEFLMVLHLVHTGLTVTMVSVAAVGVVMDCGVPDWVHTGKQ